MKKQVRAAPLHAVIHSAKVENNQSELGGVANIMSTTV